jgi:surface antigen
MGRQHRRVLIEPREPRNPGVMKMFLSQPRRRYSTVVAVLASGCLIGSSASAQFGGFSLPSFPTTSSSSEKSSDGCPKGKSKSQGSAILGGLIGQGVGRMASSAGVSSFFPSADVAGTLTNAIACKLDPEEQKQAATATIEATRGAGGDTAPPPVGASSSWTSGTRENVSGTSTVVARNDNDKGGMQCITVSDVIIVNGEETTANKRMCRAPGSSRYALMA